MLKNEEYSNEKIDNKLGVLVGQKVTFMHLNEGQEVGLWEQDEATYVVKRPFNDRHSTLWFTTGVYKRYGNTRVSG